MFSASIPIAVIAITLGRSLFKTTILENNIIQTTGSAGESIAAGVVFTLPGFLFLSEPASANFFNYWTILILAIFGGILGTLMMIPLRRSLIVKEHGVLPYPEGTACASVLKAGERGGNFAKTAFAGLGFAFAYALLQKIFHVIAEVPGYVTQQTSKYFPSAKISGEITPEYMGVGLHYWFTHLRGTGSRRRVSLVGFHPFISNPCTTGFNCCTTGKTRLPG